MVSMAAKIAQRIGAEAGTECFGVGDAGCAAAFAAIRVAADLLRAPSGPRRALVAAGAVTPGDHFFPPFTIFGDGAGALVLERVELGEPARGPRVVRSDLHTVPRYVDAVGPKAGMNALQNGGENRRAAYTVEARDFWLARELYDQAVPLGAMAVERSLERAGWTVDQLRWLMPDNVAENVSYSVAQALAIPDERLYVENCRRYGHAWVVDLFVNLSSVLAEHTPIEGDRLAAIGMGLGHNWGVLLIEA
jgi:3-oxoacyl-[acyl-carrier-protein] synthase III